MTQAKICGITTESALDAALEHGADYVGVVFFPASPRHIEPKAAAKLLAGKPKSVPSVAVTVDPDDALLDAIMGELAPDYLQLHGSESLARIAEIKAKYPVKLIKAVKVSTGDDIAGASAFVNSVDMLLFDARAPKNAMLPGGNGLSFDWHLLQGRQFLKPWMLSGGINLANVEEAVHITGARMVDVSSSVESAPGVKDPVLIRAFLEKVKSL